MKKNERDEARRLRQKGHSIYEIMDKLGCAKSSVSIWVRDIQLTTKQKKRLSKKGQSLRAIEARRVNRLRNEKAQRNLHYIQAQQSVKALSKSELTYLALGLYWGEGSKTSRGSVSFCNADPQTIQVMKRFYMDVCDVPASKFHVRVAIHPHLDVLRAEKYWEKISGVPRTQFQKTTMQQSRASKGKKDTLPYGTCTLDVYDTKLFLKIMGQLSGAYRHLVPKSRQVTAKYEAYL